MAAVFRPSARALITGGASGIGYAIAELCLQHSMRVTIADFNQETLDLAQKNLKGDVKCFKTDVGDRGAWKKLKEQVGDVDFLMLNAGVGGKGSWGDEEYFDKVSLMIRRMRPEVLKCIDSTHKLKRCYQWTEQLRTLIPVTYIG
jgi:NADP-dependent 3-hydroxy acid dehydrogenase YdfG